jgi:threonine/homoserine/homoserine lactone efflux protein
VWTLAASVGIAGLLQASQPAFVVLKIVGAGYLAFLGVQSILAAVRGRHGKEDRDMQPREIGAWSAVRQGLISNLANPKMAASSSASFLNLCKHLLAVSRRWCRWVPCFVS